MFRKQLPPTPDPHELALALTRRLRTEIAAWGPAFSYWHGVVLPYHASFKKTSREAHERFCNGSLIVTTDARVGFVAQSQADVTILDIAVEWIDAMTLESGPLPPELRPAIPPPLGRPTLTLWLKRATTTTSQPFPGGPTFTNFGIGNEACVAFAVAEASSRPIVEAIERHISTEIADGSSSGFDILDEMCLKCMSHVPLEDNFCAKCGTPAPHAHLRDP